MARPTKRQQFIKLFNHVLEQEDWFTEFREQIYKEYILHLTTGQPRFLYENILSSALCYYDYEIQRDRTLDPDEIITGIGDYVENDLAKKMTQELKKKSVL